MCLQCLPLSRLNQRHVDRGRFQPFVAECLLQGFDVSSSGDVVRRHRMPERMSGGVGDPHFLQVFRDRVLNSAFAHWGLELGDKERVVLNSGPHSQVAGHGLTRLIVERNSLSFAPFAKDAHQSSII